MKISVLMLSYNHENFIINSLDSVFKNRSLLWELEVVLIDDGSSDRTAELINDYITNTGHNIEFMKVNHGGIESISKNFNKLVKISSGDFLCFLASDDLFLENRFDEQFKVMTSDEKIVLCYSDGITVKDGLEVGSVLPKTEKLLLGTGNASLVYDFVSNNVPSIFIQGCMIRSDFAKKITLFDEGLIADDWVFNINVFKEIANKSLKFSYLDTKTFQRNIHDTNTSRDPVAHYMRVEQVCRKYISNAESIVAQQFVFSVFFCLRSKKNIKRLPLIIKYGKKSNISFLGVAKSILLILKSRINK